MTNIAGSTAKANASLRLEVTPIERIKLQFELLEIWSGYQVSRALHVAAELGISDLIKDGFHRIEHIAQQLTVNEEALYRLMRLLASYGIYEETQQRYFEQTKMSLFLVSDSELSMRDNLRMVDKPWWDSFGILLETIKSGEPAFPLVTDHSYFEYHNRYPESGERFNRGMANYAQHKNPEIVRAYDFSQFNTVVDIGGGAGALISLILKENKQIRGVLFDQEEVIRNPMHIDSAGVRERCDVVAGNFFESIPDSGDLYILQHILHDWPDDLCVNILRNCSKAMTKGCKLLVIDTVVPKNNARHSSKNSDVLMMVLLGGKERTLEEFNALTALSGLKVARHISTISGLSILEIDLL